MLKHIKLQKFQATTINFHVTFAPIDYYIYVYDMN